MNEEKIIRPGRFLVNGFLIFVLLGCEFFVLFLDVLVDGRNFSQIGVWNIHWYATIVHWLVTFLLWGTGLLLLFRWIRKNKLLGDLFKFDLDKPAIIWIAVAVLLVVIETALEIITESETVPQVYREYLRFAARYGKFALPVSIVQVSYYAVESTMVLAMAAFFQRAGELWTKREVIPWGGIGLVLTWGLVHFLSHPAGAFYTVGWAFIIGLVYVLSKKNAYPTFAVLFLAFIL
jgi:hypothetical protein